jgi:hypothetical protein
VTFDYVTSGEKAALGRILRNFRLRIRTPFQGSPICGHVIDVTSGSHVGHAQWYNLCYYYSKKKRKKTREILVKSAGYDLLFISGSSLPVTSFLVMKIPVTIHHTYDLSCPHILLMMP